MLRHRPEAPEWLPLCRPAWLLAPFLAAITATVNQLVSCPRLNSFLAFSAVHTTFPFPPHLSVVPHYNNKIQAPPGGFQCPSWSCLSTLVLHPHREVLLRGACSHQDSPGFWIPTGQGSGPESFHSLLCLTNSDPKSRLILGWRCGSSRMPV